MKFSLLSLLGAAAVGGVGATFSITDPDPAVLKWDSEFTLEGREETRKGLLGYLTVPLDYFDQESPTITLRVRAVLSNAQPAAQGPLLFHCGGPGSDDTCTNRIVSPDGGLEGAYADFDGLGITQRGMNIPVNGGQTPMPTDSPFLDCPVGSRFTPSNTTSGPFGLRDFTSCDCDLPEDTYAGVTPSPFADVTNETEVLDWLKFLESRNRRCYNSPHWTVTNAQGKEYNFLDYVGTWMLAQDLEVLRAAIGAPKLSVYGYSYGTGVGSAYASVNPDRVGRLILNGNLQLGLDGVRDVLVNQAESYSVCSAKLLTMYSGSGAEQRGEDPSGRFRELWEQVDQGLIGAPTKSGGLFAVSTSMLSYYFATQQYDTSGDLWFGLLDTIAGLQSSDSDVAVAATTQVLNTVCGPSWYDFDYCAQYMQPALTTLGVRGQDAAGRYTYTSAASAIAAVVRDWDVYTTAGMIVDPDQMASFSWAADPAPAQFGWRDSVEGIVVGSLYDCATPFVNTRWMRASFPSASLMTWQGIGHCVSSAKYDPEGVRQCNEQMGHYLITGELPSDGFVCRNTVKPIYGNFDKDGNRIAYT